MLHASILLTAASDYKTEKLLAVIPTAALALLASGIIFRFGANARANRLQTKITKVAGSGSTAPGRAPAETGTDTTKVDAQTPQANKLTATRNRILQQQGQSYLSVLLGKDERLSTSKTIAALWTVVVIYILLALILVWPQDLTAALKHLNPTYLLLLGGPYASVVLAKAAISLRTSGGSVQKTQGDGVVRLSDLVGDDSGKPDLFDAQYVSFNIIAMVFVIDAFVRATTGGFPEMPTGLALLTGGPAAVYVANKSLGTNAPVIFSVQPSVVRPEQTFTIYGQNFAPAGPPPTTAAGTAAGGSTQAVTVEVGGATADVTSGYTDTAIQAVARDLPQALGAPAGVGVVTAAGHRAYLADALTVLAKPSLEGLDTAQAAVGDHVTATGRWNTSAGQVPIVIVGGLTASVVDQPVAGTSVRFIVPKLGAVLPAAVDVKVVIAGEASETKSLKVVWPPG